MSTARAPESANILKLNIFEPLQPKLLPNLSARTVKRPPTVFPRVFTEDQLPTLLAALHFDEDEAVGSIAGKIVRFVVGSDRKLRFAKEGIPNYAVPGHGEMVSGCIAAGNIVFNAAGKLMRINNKSGDFRPYFQAVQFALQAIIQAGIPLHDFVVIEEFDDRGRRIDNRPAVSKEDLLQELIILKKMAADNLKAAQLAEALKRPHDDQEDLENGASSPSRKAQRKSPSKTTPTRTPPISSLTSGSSVSTSSSIYGNPSNPSRFGSSPNDRHAGASPANDDSPAPRAKKRLF